MSGEVGDARKRLAERARVGAAGRCGYAVLDADGIEQPCDRLATGWRWYQDCGHEDTLEAACDWHENEGGRRIAEAEAEARAARATALTIDTERMSALADRDEQRAAWLRFTSALEFGDDRSEPAATPDQMIDPVAQAFSDASEHVECPVICERCGERLADTDCERCNGSGCLPNDALAYLECDECAGAGKVHAGCADASYADLAAERDRLADVVAEVRWLADLWNVGRSPNGGPQLSTANVVDRLYAALAEADPS